MQSIQSVDCGCAVGNCSVRGRGSRNNLCQLLPQAFIFCAQRSEFSLACTKTRINRRTADRRRTGYRGAQVRTSLPCHSIAVRPIAQWFLRNCEQCQHPALRSPQPIAQRTEKGVTFPWRDGRTAGQRRDVAFPQNRECKHTIRSLYRDRNQHLFQCRLLPRGSRHFERKLRPYVERRDARTLGNRGTLRARTRWRSCPTRPRCAASRP